MIVGELLVLRRDLLGESFGPSSWIYLAAISLCLLAGQRPLGGISHQCWAFCTLVMPLYFSTALLIPALNYPILSCLCALALTIWKIGVCMSVCLHRYAAHQAFRCNQVTAFFVHWVACLANQGGALWWAANHRCHHKFCDVDHSTKENPNYCDPHSPLIDGSASAFAFLSRHPTIKEEFVPTHCDNLATRLLDTFAFVPCMVDMWLFYSCFGVDGLWVTCISGQFSQILTLYFNVLNHIPAVETNSTFNASDNHQPRPMNVFFAIMLQFLWIGKLVGEDTHRHHHEFASLAHRPGLDLPFHVFVRPLWALGCLLYTSPSPRDRTRSRMPSSA
eukprot:TRINITY_DN28304_c0_g1_i1.p1 TRINITY_DN28304_c0_g1~~TRINITY_DN28304_c0_g1_i1.p1  ORF type:complete len:333 (-),score=15.21 TRINITY_DN28304_c0_g1_i1:38-1036(-)